MEDIKISEPEKIKKLAKALSSDTRYKIVKLLTDKELSISEIADEIGQTEANTSAQIKYLEKVGIVKGRYEPGNHGVRKICKTNVKNIIISI